MLKPLNLKIKRTIIVLLIILILIFLLNNNSFFYIPCLFHKITGFYCPGCGVTRMIISIVKLDFYQAFRYNPLVFIYFPFLFFYLIYSVIIFILNKKNDLLLKIPRSYIWILLIITILFGILRNIELFSYLKPTIIK